jgi:hypothetical protein
MHDPNSAAKARTTPYAVWAIVVMVLGWLVAITTGLCGGFFVISGLADGSAYSSAVIMAGLMLGGIPCLVGVGMILAARKWGKRGAPPPANPDVFT